MFRVHSSEFTVQDGPSPSAVCLLSGGMDSFVAAAIARRDGYRLLCLSFSYGQRHSRELETAARIAAALGAEEHRVLPLDFSWARSALTDRSVSLPKEAAAGIPATYVPARNTVFISLGLAYAEARDAAAIVVGVNALDYSGYPDCRPEYLDAFRRLIALATKKTVEGGTIRLLAPLVGMTKADIVRKGIELGLDFTLSWSCYADGEKPCGECASCRLRARGFREAGVKDPARGDY